MSIPRNNGKRLSALFAIALATLAASLAGPGTASAAPEWKVISQMDTNVAPGSLGRVSIGAWNVGDENTDAGDPAWIEVVLAPGMTVTDPSNPLIPKATTSLWYGKGLNFDSFNLELCTRMDGTAIVGGETEFKCPIVGSVETGIQLTSSVLVNMAVDVAPGASGISTQRVTMRGGGAETVNVVDPTRISSDVPDFGVAAFDVMARDALENIFTQASGHPYDFTTEIDFNTYTSPLELFGEVYPVEPTKDLFVNLPPGQVGNPTFLGECTTGELANGQQTSARPLCPISSQVGTIEIRFNPTNTRFIPVGSVKVALFNMVPPTGVPARFGFNILGSMIFIDAKVRANSDYGLSLGPTNSAQTLAFNGTNPIFWGIPADPSHNPERACPGQQEPASGGPSCAAAGAPIPFLRLPTRCTGPDEYTMHMSSWAHPARFNDFALPDLTDSEWAAGSVIAHEGPGFPASPAEPTTPWGEERGLTGCESVSLKGDLSAVPTARTAETPSGLSVRVDVPNPGIANPAGIASADLKKVKVTLPEGVTLNPSQAEGLGTCSYSQYESSAVSFFPTPGRGCPDNSKIGSVAVRSQLLKETIQGDVYVAEPFANPFGSLIALYVVLENPERGILIKLPARVDPNETTGQITTTFDELPELPFSSFDFRFREGARAPLVTPRTCGKFETVAEFTGWADTEETITRTSSFEITEGVGNGPCPSGGLPPFKPGLIAGSINPNAGAFSPFNVRLFRTDEEQEITRFSIKLPPGVLGKLAGIPVCADLAIEAAKKRSGAEELAKPSCPAASEVGRTLVGAGAGSVQTFAPGKIYLAGPYHGSTLSIAAITAAKVGPFDLGTVVVRQAFQIDPETAEVFIDATASDPIPHIIDGVTIHLRDIRAYIERPNFVLNPTSCDPTATASTLLGAGLNFVSEVDDEPVTVSTRFQMANCANLDFKPRLKLRLLGGTKRGANPKFKAALRMPAGQANIARAEVTLPRSAFLDQEHIRTICTRAQYKKDACPAGSIYGYARALTPLLDGALEGPVYLRSGEHKLPDLVAGLKNDRIEIDLVGRVDSFGEGRIRTTFESLPDAPVSFFTLTLEGGHKGLIVNSTDICRRKQRALIEFDGHNGKIRDSHPPLQAQCGKARKKTGARKRAAG